MTETVSELVQKGTLYQKRLTLSKTSWVSLRILETCNFACLTTDIIYVYHSNKIKYTYRVLRNVKIVLNLKLFIVSSAVTHGNIHI